MPKTEMLINHVPGEECRIALVQDGKLEELYQERQSSESHVGNIYKGRVSNVEPSIQAAFIDFGLDRNGFLHITDLHPRYFPGKDREETERVGKKTPHRHRPPIQQCLKRGQEILVQVIKEGIGTKGPTLSSYLSIAGRYLVMMPHMERLGVSRKIEDEDLRRSLRKTLDELEVPDGFGFIIRTAGIEKSKTDLKRDLSYLQRLWKAIDRRMKQPGVGELYAEQDLVIRTLRDVFSTDIERIIVDDAVAAKRASDFLAIASPRARSKVLFYSDPVPIYDRFGIEQQIETIQSRHVPLPSGGSLVIDSTEALVAIDVNSGKMRQHKNSDTTAYKTNEEACDEVCRQLRLRDLGGVVVIDLIDMREMRKRRAIETQFRDNLKKDRARTKVLPISQLGLLEMTRQRMRPSLEKSVYNDCDQCHGTGHVKSIESVVLEAMRRLNVVMSRADINRVEITVSPNVAFHLLNRKRADIVHMEQQSNTEVLVRVNGAGSIDFIEIAAFNEKGAVANDGSEVRKEPTLTPVGELTEEQLAHAEPGSDLDMNDSDVDSGDEDDADREGTAAKSVDAKSESAGVKDGDAASEDGEKPKRKRRRRRGRGRRGKSADQGEGTAESTGEGSGEKVSADETNDGSQSENASDGVAAEASTTGESADASDQATGEGVGETGEGTGKKKRRRRRRRKKKSSTEGVDSNTTPTTEEASTTNEPTDKLAESVAVQGETGESSESSDADDAQPVIKVTYSNKPTSTVEVASDETDTSKESTGEESAPKKKRRPRRRKKSKAKLDAEAAEAGEAGEASDASEKNNGDESPAESAEQSDAATKDAVTKTEVNSDASEDTEVKEKAVSASKKKKAAKKKTAKRTTKKSTASRKVYPPPAARRSPD